MGNRGGGRAGADAGLGVHPDDREPGRRLGRTGGAPSCGAGTTAVLAPTYISSGVGGKPTVQFSAVNVQIVNGWGSEATIDGEGNLVVGYDEKGGVQTGSHNLELGGSNSYSS